MLKKGFLFFDIIHYLIGFFVYGGSVGCSLYLFSFLKGENFILNIFVGMFCYLVFLHVFVLMLGVSRLIFQPKLVRGKFPIGVNKKYLGWGINTVIEGLFFSSPLYKQLCLILYLKWIYYKLMGMKIASNSLVGMETVMRQLEFIEIGENTTIGMGVYMVAHITLEGKMHMQDTISIGSNCLIGGHSAISVRARVGDGAVIGARCAIYPGARIGKNVEMGGGCTVLTATRVPDNVKLLSGSLVNRECRMKPGETWGGNPAILIKAASE